MDGNGKKKEEEPVYINMIAGGISGAASKTATAPLARLTILYQVQSFNKGTHPHPPDLSTQALPIRTPPPSPPNPFSPLPSGSTSGSSSKGQQACTARPHAAPHPYLCRPPPPPHPPSLTQAMRNLVATEGVAALWRGNLATIIHRLPYSATNFAVFEAANKGLAPHMQSDIGRRLTAGATSGLVACIVAYPLDLVRTRLSAQRGGASNNPHQTRPLPPLAYNLPVRQGGGSGSSSNSSDTGKVLRESSATGSTHAGGGGSSSNSGGGSVKNLRMSSTTGSTNVSSSSSNNRLGMAGRPFLGPSPSSHINLCLNQQQRQQPPVSPHITLYPPNTQSPCVAQPCHASSAHPSASQLPLQQAQVLHQNAHPQPPLPSGHCLPRSNQPPLQLASSQFPCFHTPHYPWQQQQQQQPQQHLQQVLQQQQQHQLRLHHQQVQMQAQQSCLQHQQWQQPHTSSHHCPHTSSLCRSTPTMPRGSAAASLAALHRHGSTAFLITSLKSPSAEPSFQAKLRATARSAHLSTTTHTSSGGAAAAAASKKNVAATSKAAMSTASATPVPHVTPATSAPHYRGIVHALTHIVQQEGVLGLYRGLGATLLQVTPSLALNFALYDSFKDAWLKHAVTQSFEEGAWIGHIIPWSLKASSGSSSSVSVSAGNSRSSSRIPGDIVPQSLRSTNDDTDSKISNSGSGGSAAHPPHMTTSSSLVCGAAAGFCSSTLTFPLDLIRRRVQVYMANGLRGFYAGIMTEYAKVLPGMAIAFTVYEGTKELLKNVAFE